MDRKSETAPPNVPWVELLRDGRAGYTVMVLLGAMLHALQILVTVIYGADLFPALLCALFMFALVRLGDRPGRTE